jgi:hypothetical protein
MTKGALFPPLTRLESGPVGAEDYCYESVMPLLDGEEGTAVHEQDPGMQEVRGWPLPAPSLPTNSGAEESQQLLVPQGHVWPAPGMAKSRDRIQGLAKAVGTC